MSETIIAKVLDKLVDLLFSDAAARNNARRTDRDAVAAIFEQIWKSAEEIHVQARASTATAQENSLRIRELNQYILQNEIHIDREVYPLVDQYFAALKAFCDTVRQHGTADDQQQLHDTGIFNVSDMRAVSEAYQSFEKARENLLTHIRGRISELRDV